MTNRTLAGNTRVCLLLVVVVVVVDRVDHVHSMPPRLSIYDILHRGFVLSLVGLSVSGIYLGWTVNQDTLRRGRGEFTRCREHCCRFANSKSFVLVVMQRHVYVF